MNDLNEFYCRRERRSHMAISLTKTRTSKNRPPMRTSDTVVEPQHRQETMRLLRQEIAFIHNVEFERMDVESVEQATRSTPLYRDPPATPQAIPTGLPAYLANLYTIPLLSAVGEQALFRKMNFLKYRANVLRSSLDPQEPHCQMTDEIQRLMDGAERVRNHIVECNLRLVVSIARRFADGRFSFEELVSEGNVILMKAIEKFDYSRGYRFSTYATHSVQRHFYRHFRNARRRKLREIAISDQHLGELAEETTKQSDPLELSNAQLGEILSQIDEQLDEREQYILQERFGIGPSGSARTLQSLSQELQVSKERVRQLHHKAIAKLRKGLDRLFPELMTL